MKFRSSAIDEFLAILPEDLQISALQAIKEEHGRFKRGDYTEEEKRMFQMASDLGTNAAKKLEQIAFEMYNNHLHLQAQKDAPVSET